MVPPLSPFSGVHDPGALFTGALRRSLTGRVLIFSRNEE